MAVGKGRCGKREEVCCEGNCGDNNVAEEIVGVVLNEAWFPHSPWSPS